MKEALNPSPYYSFCLIGVYPSECLTDNEIECLKEVIGTPLIN